MTAYAEAAEAAAAPAIEAPNVFRSMYSLIGESGGQI